MKLGRVRFIPSLAGGMLAALPGICTIIFCACYMCLYLTDITPPRPPSVIYRQVCVPSRVFYIASSSQRSPQCVEGEASSPWRGCGGGAEKSTYMLRVATIPSTGRHFESTRALVFAIVSTAEQHGITSLLIANHHAAA